MTRRKKLDAIEDALAPLVDDHDRIAEVERKGPVVRVWTDRQPTGSIRSVAPLESGGHRVRSPLFEAIYKAGGAVFSVGENDDRGQYSVTAIPQDDSRLRG